MSHRKFEHPRCGSLGFLPRKRAAAIRGRIKAFPKDDQTAAPHLTAFMGFKAGMTHIMRELERAGSKMNKKEICEPVTIVATPPIVVIGVVGYVRTPHGLRCLKSVWASHLSDEVKRRFYRKWYRSKERAFRKYANNWTEKGANEEIQDALATIKKHAQVVRAITHTQQAKVKVGSRKAHICEIQIAGGDTAAKVDFVRGLFEKEVAVSEVFQTNEVIDSIAVSSGHGFEGATHRWGVRRLPRKTHRGLRKVACIGAWHPPRVSWTVARAGQNGFHQRTEQHKKIYMVCANGQLKDKEGKGMVKGDQTIKDITPMGGFVHFGKVTSDFLMLKGSICGPRKRIICFRKQLGQSTRRWMHESISLRFVDTSSKLGHGRFQTSDEKSKFMGPLKRDRTKRAAAATKA
jgi:large subunit ribosomal protein L3e